MLAVKKREKRVDPQCSLRVRVVSQLILVVGRDVTNCVVDFVLFGKVTSRMCASLFLSASGGEAIQLLSKAWTCQGGTCSSKGLLGSAVMTIMGSLDLRVCQVV